MSCRPSIRLLAPGRHRLARAPAPSLTPSLTRAPSRSAAAALFAALALAGCGTAPGPAATQAPAAAAPAVLQGTARSAEGAALAYSVRGRGDVAVVLIHGWTCDSSYWDAQLAALEGRYRVVTLDLAGHGRSGRPARRWSIEEFGDDVVRVADALRLERVVLVGHSLGGPVAVAAAQRLGPRALGVVGVDTLQQVGAMFGPEETEARLAPFRADFAGTVRGFVLGSFFVPESDPALQERIAASMSAAPPEVGIPALLGLNDWYGRLPSMRYDGEVVLLNAARSPVDRERLAPVLPRLTVRMFDGVGHFLMMEDPPRFNAALLEELAALERRVARRDAT